MHTHRMLLALCIVTVTAVPIAANAQGATVVGFGTAKCSVVTAIGSDKLGTTPIPVRLDVLQWVQGYLSAMSAAEGASGANSSLAYAKALHATSPEAIADAISKFCRSKPLVNASEAAFDIYRQLGGRMLQDR